MKYTFNFKSKKTTEKVLNILLSKISKESYLDVDYYNKKIELNLVDDESVKKVDLFLTNIIISNTYKVNSIYCWKHGSNDYDQRFTYYNW